jgi:hypothetical protein
MNLSLTGRLGVAGDKAETPCAHGGGIVRKTRDSR